MIEFDFSIPVHIQNIDRRVVRYATTGSEVEARSNDFVQPRDPTKNRPPLIRRSIVIPEESQGYPKCMGMMTWT